MRRRGLSFAALCAFAVFSQIAAACTITAGDYFLNPPYGPRVLGYTCCGSTTAPPPWASTYPIGSISGGTLPNGTSIVAAADMYDGTTLRRFLAFGPFAADPGQLHIASFTIGSHTSPANTAFAYSYDPPTGTATWTWWIPYGQRMNPGQAYTCSVNY